ncbi:MAG: glucose-6-phosphate dehydrogenase [Deltaproteobacteria bacterium]|nr:glucose-6-phosphate dehydrogenase [Deltaproteobacteria bacterium]
MKANAHLDPTVFIIFGAAGDLTQRKLMPALHNLFLDGLLPERFEVIGIGHGDMNDENFRNHLRDGVKTFSRRGRADSESWESFASHLKFLKVDLSKKKAYTDLAKKLAAQDKAFKTRANRIFYLALPPGMIETVTQGLAGANLHQDRERDRIVVEKPFGRDLDSARKLNRILSDVFRESQIFRIDHYLGKETVQNILAFRFGNTLFEPVWNRRYIDHVQITVAEQVGVEHRGHYYDSAGALRDMVQSHLLQILCLVAMEAPVSLADDEIRNKKVDVLHAIRPIATEQIHQFAVSGQYGAGWIEGKHVCGYREEPNVEPNSFTETFAAVRLFVDTWRWQGVPFYLRTGKRLPARVSEISIQFRTVPHQTFPPTTVLDLHPNRLIIAIQPEEGILLRFETKYPGATMQLSPVTMRFFYHEVFKIPSPDAYETLLLDVMLGDRTLFMRGDETEAAWSVITPILDVWGSMKFTGFPNYQAGAWGPEEAEVLIAQDGFSWVIPTLLVCDDHASCGVREESAAR